MNSYKLILPILIAGFFLSLISALPVTLTADNLEDRVREVSHKLRCPTCQAMSVKESEAGLSLNMKNKIREMLKEGKSEDEILKYFEDAYGEWILRSPRKKGFNLLLWGTPIVSLLVVSFLVFWYLKRRSQQPTEQTTPGLSEKERKQIERDLETFQSD